MKLKTTAKKHILRMGDEVYEFATLRNAWGFIFAIRGVNSK